MNEKNDAIARLKSFAEDKGFYIVLALCVAAIGISGYVLYATPGAGDAPAAEPAASAEGALPAASELVPDDMPVIPDVTVKLEDEPPALPEIPAEPAASVPDELPQVRETWLFRREPEYLLPVSGPVIRGYSMDALVYDRTMGDWRTHDGVDVACTLGDEVHAIADGTVTRSYVDALRGGVVEIAHGDGLTSRLCGLAADGLIAEGKTVAAGQTVGRAGTMKTESLLEPHVHLSVARGGVPIDPESLKLK